MNTDKDTDEEDISLLNLSVFPSVFICGLKDHGISH